MLHSGQNVCPRWPVYEAKYLQRAGMREGGEPLPLTFQYLILMIWRHCNLNLVMISSAASKCQDLKSGCSFFSHFMKWNWRPLCLKCWHFEASEDIMTKFKSRCLHIIRIKYWIANASGSPPSFIPAPWNIGILLNKQATLGKHFWPKCKSWVKSRFF